MDIIDILGLILFLYAVTTTIALLITDFIVKEDFGWFQAFLCFIWPVSLIAYLINRMWEK